jgi:hypothetical protein
MGVAIYCIEGKHVTVAQIAAVLQISEAAVIGRLRKLKTIPGPITWDKLRKG